MTQNGILLPNIFHLTEIPSNSDFIIIFRGSVAQVKSNKLESERSHTATKKTENCLQIVSDCKNYLYSKFLSFAIYGRGDIAVDERY